MRRALYLALGGYAWRWLQRHWANRKVTRRDPPNEDADRYRQKR